MTTPWYSLERRSRRQRWIVLIALSLIGATSLELLLLPAAILLGTMAAAIGLVALNGALGGPVRLYTLAQGLIGCLIARSMGPGILREMFTQWRIVLLCVLSVLIFSAALGGLLARWKVLPGTTAVWGSAPGAATVMILMAESFGADIRSVAFMQFLRVALVDLFASLIARLSMAHSAPAPSVDWFLTLTATGFSGSMAIAVVGSLLGARSKLPAGALLLPMAVAIACATSGVLPIELPPWLMAASNAIVGWAIGLGFTREILSSALQAFPRVLASTLTLIALCGGLAYGLHEIAGTDLLTAYLATSPGGADSVAIIAAASPVDVPFVMAMQTARFLLVLAVGPALARAVARWV